MIISAEEKKLQQSNILPIEDFDDLESEITAKSPPNIPFKKEPPEFSQTSLFPSYIFDLIPKDHDCFAYAQLFKQLDFSSIMDNYSPYGQHAFNPMILTALLIYAYIHGVFSSREIINRCKTDLAFMYICRMNPPSYVVLCVFRQKNQEFFKEVFKQSVLIADSLNMAPMNHVSLDGTKFKANTSKHKAMSYGRMKSKETELQNDIDILLEKAKEADENDECSYTEEEKLEIENELEFKQKRFNKISTGKQALEERENKLHPNKEIPDKKQISFADIEARIMGKIGKFDYAYNVQFISDQETGIILSYHVTQNANDKQEIEPAVLNIIENTGRLPEIMTCDNGYYSGVNLKALKDYEINAFVATGKEGKKEDRNLDECKRNLIKSDFVYNEEEDCFICPEGNILSLKSKNRDGKRIYSASSECCKKCKYQGRCCKSKKGNPRTISIDDYEPYREEMNNKMRKEESKEIYAKRKGNIETVIGQIKNTGMTKVNVRGFIPVKGEMALPSAGHNMKKIIKNIKENKLSLNLDKIMKIIRDSHNKIFKNGANKSINSVINLVKYSASETTDFLRNFCHFLIKIY